MQFFEYVDGYTLTQQKAKRLGASIPYGPDEFYAASLETASRHRDPFGYRQVLLEQPWIADGRPYYNVWPAVFPMVDKLRLDIPCSSVHCPLPSLALRLPEIHHNPFVFGHHECVRSILFGEQEVSREIGSSELIRGLCIAIDIGEVDPATQFPIFTFKFFPLREDLTIDQAANILPYHESWTQGKQVPQQLVQDVVKLCCTVCLIGNDPDLIQEDVLAKDRNNFRTANEAGKKVIIDRARRRGKYGFNLGAELEVIPHYRRPHLAVVWTGKGRTTAKVVTRKGSVVHREKLSSVPTGRKDDDQV